MKRVTRKGRHVRFGQIPLNCPFSGRRSQSPAVAASGQCTPTWLLYGATFMPPRKRAQGFDVALYRRGAGRLLAAEEEACCIRALRMSNPDSQRKQLATATLPTRRGKSHPTHPNLPHPTATTTPKPLPQGRPRRAKGSRRRPSKRRGEGKGPFPFKPRNRYPTMSAGDPPKGGSNVQPRKRCLSQARTPRFSPPGEKQADVQTD